jgi:hypothetical protein
MARPTPGAKEPIAMPDREADQRLISATAAALKLGVDVETLMRWHRRHRGPVARTDPRTHQLAYRCSDLEAWQDRISG